MKEIDMSLLGEIKYLKIQVIVGKKKRPDIGLIDCMRSSSKKEGIKTPEKNPKKSESQELSKTFSLCKIYEEYSHCMFFFKNKMVSSFSPT